MKHNSSIQSGRTIAERREKLETASERAETHKKNRTKQILRVTFTVVGFVAAALGLVRLAILFFTPDGVSPEPDTITVVPQPTIEVVDEATVSSSGLTSRMKGLP